MIIHQTCVQHTQSAAYNIPRVLRITSVQYLPVNSSGHVQAQFGPIQPPFLQSKAVGQLPEIIDSSFQCLYTECNQYPRKVELTKRSSLHISFQLAQFLLHQFESDKTVLRVSCLPLFLGKSNSLYWRILLHFFNKITILFRNHALNSFNKTLQCCLYLRNSYVQYILFYPSSRAIDN